MARYLISMRIFHSLTNADRRRSHSPVEHHFVCTICHVEIDVDE